jgi:hypothetical protein
VVAFTFCRTGLLAAGRAASVDGDAAVFVGSLLHEAVVEELSAVADARGVY